MAGGAFKGLYGTDITYYLTINDLGKRKEEKLVTIFVMMHNWRGFINAEGLEYRTGSSLRLRALKWDAIQ